LSVQPDERSRRIFCFSVSEILCMISSGMSAIASTHTTAQSGFIGGECDCEFSAER
jgi:hypothetical protein